MNNLRTFPPKFLQKPSPYFFMVHLLHRLYDVDALASVTRGTLFGAENKDPHRSSHVVTIGDRGISLQVASIIIIIGAAAQKTAQNKIDKYSKLASTHIFYPFAVETAGTWHEMAIELTQEIGRRITTITEDPGDNIPFPTPFHGSAKRKCGFFPQHHGNRVNCRCNHNFVCLA